MKSLYTFFTKLKAEFCCRSWPTHIHPDPQSKAVHRSIPVRVTTWDQSPKLRVLEFWVEADVDAERTYHIKCQDGNSRWGFKITITSKHLESICTHTKRLFIRSNSTDTIPMNTQCLASVSMAECKQQQAYNLKPTTSQHIQRVDPCNFNSLPYNHSCKHLSHQNSICSDSKRFNHYCKQTPRMYLKWHRQQSIHHVTESVSAQPTCQFRTFLSSGLCKKSVTTMAKILSMSH